jgi:hypothetical protein
MAGFLAIYALTMLIQFISYFLGNASVLQEEIQVSDLQSTDSIKTIVQHIGAPNSKEPRELDQAFARLLNFV